MSSSVLGPLLPCGGLSTTRGEGPGGEDPEADLGLCSELLHLRSVSLPWGRAVSLSRLVTLVAGECVGFAGPVLRSAHSLVHP